MPYIRMKADWTKIKCYNEEESINRIDNYIYDEANKMLYDLRRKREKSLFFNEA